MTFYYIREILTRVLLFLIFLYTEYFSHPHHMEMKPALSRAYAFKSNRHNQLLTPHNLFLGIIITPLLVFLAVNASKGKIRIKFDEILALTGVFALNGVITNSLKLTIGRPRPDFLARCVPISPLWEAIPECSGSLSAVEDGYKSFPSGHASWSFSTLFFLTLYLAGRLNVVSQFRVRYALLVLSLTPFLVGCCVGWSRVHDHMHHFGDVFAGAVLGCTISSLCYFQYFPSLLSQDSHRTLRELREIRLVLIVSQKDCILQSVSPDSCQLRIAHLTCYIVAYNDKLHSTMSVLSILCNT